MAELAAAADADKAREEAGDLLFAAVNLVRAHGIAPEEALRAANAKFETPLPGDVGQHAEHLALLRRAVRDWRCRARGGSRRPQ
jgi:hypothetical protein